MPALRATGWPAWTSTSDRDGPAPPTGRATGPFRSAADRLEAGLRGGVLAVAGLHGTGLVRAAGPVAHDDRVAVAVRGERRVRDRLGPHVVQRSAVDRPSHHERLRTLLPDVAP